MVFGQFTDYLLHIKKNNTLNEIKDATEICWPTTSLNRNPFISHVEVNRPKSLFQPFSSVLPHENPNLLKSAICVAYCCVSIYGYLIIFRFIDLFHSLW